jgi:hypothetical protein
MDFQQTSNGKATVNVSARQMGWFPLHRLLKKPSHHANLT